MAGFEKPDNKQSREIKIIRMNDLQTILDLFGLEFHNCKFEGKELPKLALVVNPNEKNISAAFVTKEFQHLPAVAFNVSILSGSEYAKISVLGANSFSDKDGWDLFNGKGFCCYNHKDKTVYIGCPYPYDTGADLPMERAIFHELGHYKQDVLYEANIETCNNLVLEYHNIMVNENKSQTQFGSDSRLGIEDFRITYNKIEGPINILGVPKIDVFLKDYHFEVKVHDLYYIVKIYNKNVATSIEINKLDYNDIDIPKKSEILRNMETLIKQTDLEVIHILFINMLNDLYKEKSLSIKKL